MHLKVVVRLLTAEADVDDGVAYNCSWRNLQAVSWSGYLQMAEWLLVEKTNVNIKEAKYLSQTAIYITVEARHLEAVQQLLIAKVEMNAEVSRNVVKELYMQLLEHGIQR